MISELGLDVQAPDKRLVRQLGHVLPTERNQTNELAIDERAEGATVWPHGKATLDDGSAELALFLETRAERSGRLLKCGQTKRLEGCRVGRSKTADLHGG